jgi:uncharacterized protein YndB with AHSA1/START domain
MASSGTAVVTLPTETEILITREFDAPKRLVWQAFTTPELVSQWWPGQRGEMKSCEIDLRVGGAYRYVMTASEGFEVAFHGEFQEIVPEERLVHTEVFEGAPEGSAPALSINEFTEAGGRTTLSMLMRLESREVRDMIVATGMESGVQEGMDILEQLVTEGARASAAS